MATWFEVYLSSEHVGQSWFVVELTSDHVPDDTPPPDIQIGGGAAGRPFTFGAGAPAFEKAVFGIDVEVDLYRSDKVEVQGEFSLNRRSTSEIFASIDLHRSHRVQFACAREPAEYFLSLRREDEELLMLL